MSEERNRLAAPPQREETLSDARYPALHQHRECLRGQSGQHAPAFGGIGNACHQQFASAIASRHDRPVRLDDAGEEAVRDRLVPLFTRGDDARFRNPETARLRLLQHVRLVGRRPVRRQIGKR